MNFGKTVFSQVMDQIDPNEFRRFVRQQNKSHRKYRFSCWEQFLCMAFAQLTYRESLRDIESCLRSLGPKLYHSGIRSTVCRSTLAYANEHRSWKIYQELALSLIAKAQRLYRDDRFLADLDGAVYAFDSSIIKLCLELFPWARAANHQATCAGVKLHTLLDVQSNVPVFARITAANVGDLRILDELVYEAGAFYVLDRGYTGFTSLKRIDNAGAFFVIRAKRDLRFSRVYSHTISKIGNVRVDQTITLVIPRSREEYPDQLRRIKVFDPVNKCSLVFLTNNFVLDALTVAELYRLRWKIELFFKWIKQHLRIKAFLGTTPNAVSTQIWIALSVYVLVAIVKKELGLEQPLYTILQILSVTLFEKEPILQVLTESQHKVERCLHRNQLNLFNL
jgi:hypothetical protein